MKPLLYLISCSYFVVASVSLAAVLNVFPMPHYQIVQ